MTIQVAVASVDGLAVNQHFGRAERFLIYRIGEDGRTELAEDRPVRRACGNGDHETEALAAAAAALADCRFALVARIGPAAEKALAKRGVLAFETAGPVERALGKLAAHLSRSRSRTAPASPGSSALVSPGPPLLHPTTTKE